MKYEAISNKLFIDNRANYIKHLKPNSLALFFSNDLLPTNADGNFGFVQNSDLFYLSGIDQEDSILLIFPVVSGSAMAFTFNVIAPGTIEAVTGVIIFTTGFAFSIVKVTFCSAISPDESCTAIQISLRPSCEEE